MNSSYNNNNEDAVISNMPNISTSNPTSDNSIMSWISYFFFNRYILIILILSFLGINLFSYFDTIIKSIVSIFRPLLAVFGYTIGETAKETVKVVKVGSKDVIDVAAGTLTGGINLLEKGLTGKKDDNDDNDDENDNQMNYNNNIRNKSSFPIPDDAGSRTQANTAKSKAGYCYIGEDRGFRSCIQVNDSDMCMSGEIFPTQDICINPSLRQ